MTAVVKYTGGKSGSGFDLSGDRTGVPSGSGGLVELNRSVAGVDRRGRRVSQALLAQTLKNNPFDDYPQAVYGYKRAFEEEHETISESCSQAVENFLRRTFHSLTFIHEISFDVREVFEKAERKAFNSALGRYRAARMGGQAALLKELYDGLCALRIVLKDAGQANLLETVMPVRFLPEILLAAPVWFIEQKGEEKRGDVEFERDALRYFCDLGATDHFAYLFQIYNRRRRYFDEFSGRDIMPLFIIDYIRKTRHLFDYLVIATPYHDIASKEWGEVPWARSVDPFLLGFLKQVPELVFFLGRWSGKALFPRIVDMMAETVEHLNQGKSVFGNLSELGLVWYRTETRVDFENMCVGPRLKPIEDYQLPKALYPRSRAGQERWRMENHSLIKFVDTVRRQFETGSVFSWLRGEREETVTLYPRKT